MAVVEGLIQTEADGSLSFGNHTLAQKAKKEDFEHGGDLFKVKTYGTMTKLERNGMNLTNQEPRSSTYQKYVNSWQDFLTSIGGGVDVRA